jgi:hypothetical protein
MHEGKVSYVDQFYYHKKKGVRPIEENTCEYFVHPTTGVLLKNHKNKKYKQAVAIQREVSKKAEEARNLKLLAEFDNKDGKGERWAVKIKDNWYEIAVIAKPKPEKRSRVIDNETGKREYFTHYPTYDEVSVFGARFLPYRLINGTHYAARKQAMSSQAIRKHGLND